MRRVVELLSHGRIKLDDSTIVANELPCGVYYTDIVEDDPVLSPSAAGAMGLFRDWDDIFAVGPCALVWHHYADDCSTCPLREE